MRLLIDVSYVTFKLAAYDVRWKLMDKFVEAGGELVYDSRTSLRRTAYDWYKANRGDALPPVTQRLRKLAHEMQRTCWTRYSSRLEVDGLEADDVLAMEAQDCDDCVVVTEDHDLLQLSNAWLVNQHMDPWGIDRLKTKLPLRKGRSYLAYQLLHGCSTDTVPRRLFSRDTLTAKWVFQQTDPLRVAIELLPEDLCRESLDCLLLPCPLYTGQDSIIAALAKEDT
jgi:hypothetical protein